MPQIAQLLSNQKVELIAESKAGICAGFKDSDYTIMVLPYPLLKTKEERNRSRDGFGLSLF
nr:hypothetical protein [Sporomusa silvacetica]